MTTTNREIMSNARAALKGKWGLAIGTMLVYMLIICVTGSLKFIGCIISLIIGGPLVVGLYSFFLSLVRKEPGLKIARLFSGFSLFKNAFITYLLVVVFTVLWTLLLIVPGIIAALSYAMTFPLLVDNPQLSGREAIKTSKIMMYG